jgi:hypothetical protein
MVIVWYWLRLELQAECFYYSTPTDIEASEGF